MGVLANLGTPVTHLKSGCGIPYGANSILKKHLDKSLNTIIKHAATSDDHSRGDVRFPLLLPVCDQYWHATNLEI